jgi:hypothetical protein
VSNDYFVARYATANTCPRAGNCDQQDDTLDHYLVLALLSQVGASPHEDVELEICCFRPKVTQVSAFQIEITFLNKNIKFV